MNDRNEFSKCVYLPVPFLRAVCWQTSLPYDIRLYLQFDIDDYIGYQTDNEMTATATQKDVSIIYYDYIPYAYF